MSVLTYVVPSPIDSNQGTVQLDGGIFRCRTHVDSPICHECSVDGVYPNDSKVVHNIYHGAIIEQLQNMWDGEDVHLIFHGSWPEQTADSGFLQPLPVLRICFDALFAEAQEKAVPKLFSAELNATCIVVGQGSTIVDCFAGQQPAFIGTSLGEKQTGEKGGKDNGGGQLDVPGVTASMRSPKVQHPSTPLTPSQKPKPLHISEVPRNSMRFCVKNVTVVPLEKADGFEKLMEHAIATWPRGTTLVVSINLSQVCAIAKPRVSRAQFFFFSGDRATTQQTIEVFSSFPKRQPPPRAALNTSMNYLLASCITCRPSSNIVLFESLDHSKAIESLNVLASVKAVGLATLLDKASLDVVAVNNMFESQRQMLRQKASELTTELQDFRKGEEAQAHTIAELSTVANFGASTLSQSRVLSTSQSMRKMDEQSSDDDERDQNSESAFSECAELLEQIAAKEDEIIQYEAEAEKNRVLLAYEVTDAEEAWKEVSNRAMQFRKDIDHLKTEIANRQYSSACAQVALERTFDNDLQVLMTNRHSAKQLRPQSRDSQQVSSMSTTKLKLQTASKERRWALSFSSAMTPRLKALYERRRSEVVEKIHDEQQAVKRLRLQLDVERSRSASVLQSYNTWFAALCEFAFRARDVLHCYRRNPSIMQHFYEWLVEVEGCPTPRLIHRSWKECVQQHGHHSSSSDDTVSDPKRLVSFLRYPPSNGPVVPLTVRQGCQTDATLQPPVVLTLPDWVSPDRSRARKLKEELFKFRALVGELSP